jgi:hypothetical protein
VHLFGIFAVYLGEKLLSGLCSEFLEAFVDGLACGKCAELHFILIIICPMVSIGINRSFKEVQHARGVREPNIHEQQQCQNNPYDL